MWNCHFRKNLQSPICLYFVSIFLILFSDLLYIFLWFIGHFLIFYRIPLIYMAGIALLEKIYSLLFVNFISECSRHYIWTWINHLWGLEQIKNLYQCILIGHKCHQRTVAPPVLQPLFFFRKTCLSIFFWDFLAIFSHFIGFSWFMCLELPV